MPRVCTARRGGNSDPRARGLAARPSNSRAADPARTGGGPDNDDLDNEDLDNEDLDNEDLDNEDLDNEDLDNEDLDNGAKRIFQWPGMSALRLKTSY
jgi:uncharacterized protein YjbI with pentapeptide repeats